MTETVTTDDLTTYLGRTVEEDRAQFVLDQVTVLANAVVTPLPDGASAVIVTAAARAYMNPVGAKQEAVGPFQVTPGSPGIYLTRGERRTLRSLAGKGGGAFTIDPTDVNAMTNYVDPLAPPTNADAEQWFEETGL